MNSGLKDKALLTAWVTGLLLIISLIWIFSQPLQSRYLMRTVNSVFMNNNDARRLASPIPRMTDNANLLGYWYSMNNSQDKMFVFAVFQDGILIPLGAVISGDGNVNELIPLSAHAMQIFDSIPKSILQVYIRRIETAVITQGDK
ncbi:MAG: hypothetical protein FWB73_02670 [Treponema sp.]|nr:hypothetical protein [Treponema sp.]